MGGGEGCTNCTYCGCSQLYCGTYCGWSYGGGRGEPQCVIYGGGGLGIITYGGGGGGQNSGDVINVGLPGNMTGNPLGDVEQSLTGEHIGGMGIKGGDGEGEMDHSDSVSMVRGW